MVSVLGERTRKADIKVRRNGRIDISARVVRMLGIRPGDVVDLAVDDGEYYLYVRRRHSEGVHGRHEGVCTPTTKNGRGTYRVWSCKLAAPFLGYVPYEVVEVRMPCGVPVEIDGRKYVPVIIGCRL